MFPQPSRNFQPLDIPAIDSLDSFSCSNRIVEFVSYIPEDGRSRIRSRLHDSFNRNSLAALLKNAKKPSSEIHPDLLRKTQKILQNSPEKTGKNEDRRLAFRWYRSFAVKSKFSFGLRRVETGRSHIIQTDQARILYYETKASHFGPNDLKSFRPSLLRSFEFHILAPYSAYVVPPGRWYVILTHCKCCFSLNDVSINALPNLGLDLLTPGLDTSPDFLNIMAPPTPVMSWDEDDNNEEPHEQNFSYFVVDQAASEQPSEQPPNNELLTLLMSQAIQSETTVQAAERTEQIPAVDSEQQTAAAQRSTEETSEKQSAPPCISTEETSEQQSTPPVEQSPYPSFSEQELKESMDNLFSAMEASMPPPEKKMRVEKNLSK